MIEVNESDIEWDDVEVSDDERVKKMKEPTKAQIRVMEHIERRDCPAGEPRTNWFNKATIRVLLSRGWVVERAGTSRGMHQGNILDLTDSGRAALAAAK